MKTGSTQTSPPLCCSVCRPSRRKRGCHCATLTGRGTVFPGHHPQVTTVNFTLRRRKRTMTEVKKTKRGKVTEAEVERESTDRKVLCQSLFLCWCVLFLYHRDFTRYKFCILPTGSVSHQTCLRIHHLHITVVLTVVLCFVCLTLIQWHQH